MNTFFNAEITKNGVNFRYTHGRSIAKGNEMHPFHEILFYLAGDATFLSEQFREPLTENTLLLIPKECYHKFRIGNQDNYRRLAISFPDLPDISDLIPHSMTGIRLIPAPSPFILQMLSEMYRILSDGRHDSAAGTFLYGAFLSLMALLCDTSNDTVPTLLQENSPLLSLATDYIDRHFTTPLTVQDIASALNVSPSTLFQCFQKDLGISIHHYITEKRLVYARHLLSEGNTLSAASRLCGYRDYSSFFKAYVKIFGHSPSADKARP